MPFITEALPQFNPKVDLRSPFPTTKPVDPVLPPERTPKIDLTIFNPSVPTRITERDITSSDAREDILDRLEDLGFIIRGGQVIGKKEIPVIPPTTVVAPPKLPPKVPPTVFVRPPVTTSPECYC